MKQKPFSVIILGVFLSSLLFWIYLIFNTQQVLENDAIGYEQLGRLIHTQGYIPYFETGPNREPFYPSLVALSMYLEPMLSISYTKIIATLSVIFLFISQLLTYCLLQRLNVRPLICVIILIYFGLSPALANTAFSLYSEIAAIPFVLMAAWLTAHSFETLPRQRSVHNCLIGVALGLLFITITLTKSIFEPIFFIFVIVYLGFFLKSLIQNNKRILLNTLVLLLTFYTVYAIPIHAYKMLNKKYNNHYAITDRGSWALYGSCALKTEPLTPRGFLIALAHVPGKGACTKFFTIEECSYWEPNVTSDSLGAAKLGEFRAMKIPEEEADQFFLTASKDRVMEHPFQFTLLSTLDWIKMFFWESTKIGFVTYPPWLAKIHDTGIFKDGLRLLVSLVSLIAFFGLIGFLRSPLDFRRLPTTEAYQCFSLFVIVLFYTALHALFNTVPRWALPIAPLYLLAIGYALQHWWPQTKKRS